MLLMTWGSACAVNTGPAVGAGGSGGSAGSGGSDASVVAPTEPVCGETGHGFVALQSAGGQVPLGAQVLTELGARYVVVDPSCRFVVYDSTSGHRGAAAVGQLSKEQAGELSTFLALQEWDDLSPTYGWSACDGPNTRFVWADRLLDLVAFCPASPIQEPPGSFRHDSERLAAEVASRLRPLGEPSDGPVRYLLLADEDGTYPSSGFEEAPEWPLAFPPASVALSQEEAMEADVSVQTAAGSDAQQLRLLRTEFLRGEYGFSDGFFVPIEQPDGSRFALFVRDVIEFETEDGEPFVPWADLGAPIAR